MTQKSKTTQIAIIIAGGVFLIIAGVLVGQALLSSSSQNSGQPNGTTAQNSNESDPPGNGGTAAKSRNPLLNDPGTVVIDSQAALETNSDKLESGGVFELNTDSDLGVALTLSGDSTVVIASPGKRPRFRKPLTIKGGKSVHFEGVHFEPSEQFKPAIILEQLPEKMTFRSCTFRHSLDGPLIQVLHEESTKGAEATFENCFLSGYILFDFENAIPPLRFKNCCLVADLTVFEVKTTADVSTPGQFGILVSSSTLVTKNVFTVRFEDFTKGTIVPYIACRLNDNIVSLSRKPQGSFFQWESWKRPDIAMDHFQFSGSNNSFSGIRGWAMTTLNDLTQAGSRPQLVIEKPAEWGQEWATEVTGIHMVPPEFKVAGRPRRIEDVQPADYALAPLSELRKLGRNGQPLGANVDLLP